MSFGIRFCCPDDLDFIREVWIKETTPPKCHSFVEAKAYFKELMMRPNMVVRVAHVPDDESAILGWVILEPPAGTLEACVHYAYVREKARGLGIFKALVAELLDKKCQYSSKPRIPVKLPNQWQFHPERAL